MLARQTSGPQGPWQLSSPDRSSCSSDTADVIIRSTRIREPGPGSVQITVQRLRDPPAQCPVAEQRQQNSGTEKRQQRAEPRQRPDSAPPLRAAAHRQSERRKMNKPEPNKENRRRTPDSAPHRNFSAGRLSEQQTGHDLLTSRFAAGGRGVVMAALSHRSHSAPHRREVKVQLLDRGPLQTSSHDAPVGVAGVQVEAGLSSGCPGDATKAAATAMAPLIEVQSLMEARLSHLDDGVQRLLQADRKSGGRGRSLSDMTLHHLETLQSQLLESAVKIVTSHAPSATCDLTASENVLSNQHRSSPATRAAAAVETGLVTMATCCCDRWPEQTRDSQPAPSVSTATQSAAGSHLQSSANHSQALAKRANEMLEELGHLKSEMKTLLTVRDSLKTTRSGPDPHQTQSLQSHSERSQSHQSHQSQQSQQPQQPHQFQSVLVQRKPMVPSTLEEAGQVLRLVRRRKKVLEENLESQLRARTGDVLQCQLEALAANRNSTKEVRIRKTVDAWISTLTRDIQAEISSDDAVCRPSDAAVTAQQRAAGSSAHSSKGRLASALRGTGSRPAARRGSRGQTAAVRLGSTPDTASGRLTDPVEDGEAYLTRLYGRAPYEGLRRTLKKSPYLRFSSPASPLCRKPRPRLVESIRGVKVKSCKTQTGLAPPLSPQRHYIIHSSHLTAGDPADLTTTPADMCAVAMAIPLGRPRMDSSPRRLTDRQQEVTSPPSAPPMLGVVAVDNGASEPQSQKAEQLHAGEAPPPLPPVDIMETESEEEEGKEDVFPGADFLSVADIIQEPLSAVGEEVSAVGEEAVELDGGPSPLPVLYQGPVFPPQARPALPAQNQAPILGPNLQRDALENRLVEWVEQQLMSRMISEMYRPPPSDPAHNISTDQSEAEEQSVTSDIVEAAGGAGLQLFIDSNISVDSVLIRQLVNEVLTEHIALMLGHRDTTETGPGLEPPKPGPGAFQEEKLVPLVPTPLPTPPASPSPCSREPPPLTTPPPSEPTSLLNEESLQPITAPEPVATPTPSPEPAHISGSPQTVHQAPPPLTWGDAELPLDEERPEEHQHPHPQPLLMSVAEEEPPLSSPPPPSPSPPPPSPDPIPVSPPSSSEDSSSSSSSSSAVTAETDTVLKHISEGELLISISQPAAMTEVEAVCSFSSSLQELQEMDFDPPSEGQVRGHNLLLTKMEQRVTHTHGGEGPQPQGCWGRDAEEGEEVSVGEVRDGWTTKPHRTTNPNSYCRSTAAQQGQSSSPGQISQNVSDISFEATNQGSVIGGDLMVEPIGALTSDLQTGLLLSPPPPPPHLENTHTAGQVAPVVVRQSDRQTAEQQRGRGGGGSAERMDVHLPFVGPEEEQEEQEEQEEEEEETDSSISDAF
ncbi:protein TALPID3 [Pempheris klunzingeri]|uniref:protein TALPID3 n=1 Tax=Pempheris klunzingeri TaxID=3127111 RepID=UPI00397E9B3A